MGQRNELRCVHGTPYLVSCNTSKFLGNRCNIGENTVCNGKWWCVIVHKYLLYLRIILRTFFLNYTRNDDKWELKNGNCRCTVTCVLSAICFSAAETYQMELSGCLYVVEKLMSRGATYKLGISGSLIGTFRVFGRTLDT